MSENLNALIQLSRWLGEPRRDYVILGEGNTSTQAPSGTFWVKASGTRLVEAGPDSFVRVRSTPILESLDRGDLDDAGVKQLLEAATVEGQRSPSIETFLHAMCLQLDGVQFVGHTHPTIAVSLLSCQRSRELFTGSLFPDQIVLLGPEPVYVPYTDPGLPLARTVRDAIDDFLTRCQRTPRVILMENHGVIALGGTIEQVQNVTQMVVKTCHILAGTLPAGGPRFLEPAHVQRIDQRPDELARRKDLSGPDK
jgi:rhamnose utilization protein RhaD (predicted bifunctional aldolase and dehydrogenase)